MPTCIVDYSSLEQTDAQLEVELDKVGMDQFNFQWDCRLMWCVWCMLWTMRTLLTLLLSTGCHY